MSREIELGMKTAAILSEIADERARQIDVEGWTPNHDDGHIHGQMAIAAGEYALHAACTDQQRNALKHKPPVYWPWSNECWKPKTRRRDLIRSAALIVAEIERLDRAYAQDEVAHRPE